MSKKLKVQFTAKDGVILRGWLFLPEKQIFPVPGIILTNGFSALKEHSLEKFAKRFSDNNVAALLYDNRNFGESDGEPRYEVDPAMQVKDLSLAIDFLETIIEVDNAQINIFGISFSGGNAIVAASSDKRINKVVACVPFVKGHHEYLKEKNPKLFEIIQKKYLKDKQDRAKNLPPKMTPVVTKDPEKSAVMVQPEAYDFFTSVDGWENKVTLRSLENSGEYSPIDFIDKVSPTPLLFIVAESDTICITKLQLEAFAKALEPKKLIMIQGHHFVPFDKEFEAVFAAAKDWLK